MRFIFSVFLVLTINFINANDAVAALIKTIDLDESMFNLNIKTLN